MSQTTSTFKLPKRVKTIMSNIVDPVARNNFKNAMIGAIIEGNKVQVSEKKSRS
jgi:hypothetical protein